MVDIPTGTASFQKWRRNGSEERRGKGHLGGEEGQETGQNIIYEEE